ncbi:3-phenylpropionate/trans-cinnamate dioxygenase ferredoxin reductase subunit [Cohaesibacter sp. ES.047]|uniref:NAD(P)/FAD-dependent oxidoreductase n=1 Tax=Cohaesibacter sp. ES.047 TaxID=1798205 RepID=UPI000BB7B58F|nr:FAD/NAD(P)-binding oxidoreductase [Cohaesibacter sp. ES.047]SNY92668.1 3-phenylpropionate/trans-cinnamate dioxygenase ferredoxin reductase subunit [Cohaesibacter sp. ES.047]
MRQAERIVVVGAGQAGATLAQRLRDLGYDGALTLIGSEPYLPYQRPPLSKAYLLGDMDLDGLTLRPQSFYDDLNIEVQTGRAVTAIEKTEKLVSIGDETLPYDHLALVTGSDPLRLPEALGGHLAGVHVVRGLSDIDALEPEIVEGRKALIVGGGYIGLEAAAVCAKRGLDVTLIEAAPRILQRVAARETSNYFRALHESHGVKLLENSRLAHFVGDERVTGALLDDGIMLDADFVICGIGVRPSTGLAEAAGLDIDNGIATNVFAQTSVPNIWAAGDCASFLYNGDRIRLESVGNAIDQAKIVAENIVASLKGETLKPYVAKPWFWSDQFDVKLQIAGLNRGYDRIVTRDSGAGVMSFWYYRGDQLIAIDAMNDPRAYMVGKRLIEAGKTADPNVVRDASTDLKSLMKR